jgi:hypothetical protein
MKKRNLLTILLAFALAYSILGVGSNAAPMSQKSEVTGTVISYNLFARLTLIIGQMSKPIEDHDELLIRVNKSNGNLEKGQYIKLRFTNSENPNVHLPKDMLERAQQWQFTLTRDNSCDESTEDVLYMQGKNGRELNKSWKRLAGAEKERISEDANLPCYVFGVNDFRKGNSSP